MICTACNYAFCTNLPAVQHFLFGHGDTPLALDSTRRVLDELATDFITELCFEAHRAAQVAGRQKVKLEDVKFACRKSPIYLGKIEEIFGRKEIIDKAKKLVDMNDDKITKSNVMGLEEEPLGAADDDADVGSVSGVSQPGVSQKSKKSKTSVHHRESNSKMDNGFD